MEQPAGQVAIVTGAGSGIGAAVVHGLLAAGWRVGLAGRREAALGETAHAAVAAGAAADAALVLPTDVSREADVAAVFAAVTDAWGRVDLLFNNAGVFGTSGSPDEIDPADWRAVVDINLTGSFLCAREAFRVMRHQDPQGGRIINNGSISAHVPRPHAAAYTATKHAVTGLTRQLSLDGRPYSIACGQIDIGNAVSEMSQAQLGRGSLQANGEIRIEPMMDVRHAADAVLHMAGLPLDANVEFMTVMATTMPYIGRG